jgi:hypothetical protein
VDVEYIGSFGYTSDDAYVFELIKCQTRLIEALKIAGANVEAEEMLVRGWEYKFTGYHPDLQGGMSRHRRGKQNVSMTNETGVRIGPNGGRYRVTTSGRKVYI